MLHCQIRKDDYIKKIKKSIRRKRNKFVPDYKSLRKSEYAEKALWLKC